MKSKRHWLLLIIPLALLVWAWQAAAWRPKLVGVQPNSVQDNLSNNPAASRLLISPDGQKLVSSWQNYREFWIAMWDVNSRQQKWKLSDEFCFPLAFSPDSRALAVGYRKGTYQHPYTAIVILDVSTKKQRGPQMLPYYYIRNLQSAVFLSNHELVVATSQGATVVDTQTGKPIRQWKFELPVLSNTKLPRPNNSHVAADGSTVLALANGTSETAVAIYDVKTGKRRGVWTYKGVFRNLRLSPDGTLWTAEREKNDSIDVYDARTGKKLWGPFEGNKTNAPWAWSADSQRLALPKREGVSFFDARNQNFLILVSGARGNQALALSPNGDFLYTLDDTGKIWRWRAR